MARFVFSCVVLMAEANEEEKEVQTTLLSHRNKIERVINILFF